MARHWLTFWVGQALLATAHGSLHKRALRRPESAPNPVALVSPSPLTPLSNDEVASAAELEEIQKDLKASEADRAKITMLQKSLQTQQLLAAESQAVVRSFSADEYPGSVLQEQQQQLKEFSAQTQGVLGFSAKAAKEASQKALESAVAIEKAAVRAQQKAEKQQAEAKKASELSAKLASEAKVELQRVQAAVASPMVKPDKTQPATRHDSRATNAPSRLQTVAMVKKTNSTGLADDSQEDGGDSEDGDLD
ncbi:unnamed protein product [Symbiodinium pilosum]|uniref:Uncharacterized protein n=1 Tax=Symbiodinium pilosum TaxID=2952 RepID=A0A812YGL3_SYMPI|nr:unnamed protein product [Symbiodinium pilosum]